MIIDFHSHTYPRKIANMVVGRLSGPSGVKAYTDATNEGLIQSCIKNDIERCVILPVVTNEANTESMNKAAIEVNHRNNIILSFGTIHPNNNDYREILSNLAHEGIIGIKLHPIFQKTCIDDIKYLQIIDRACELGMIISIHAGLDINDPEAKYSNICHIKNLLKTVKPDKLILAHMAGHLCWNEAEDMLTEYLHTAPSGNSLYVDTAFCLPSPVSSQNIDYQFLSNDQFVRMVRLIGTDKVLFGTDSPWTDQGPSIEAIKNSGLTKRELSQILYENAKALLNC